MRGAKQGRMGLRMKDTFYHVGSCFVLVGAILTFYVTPGSTLSLVVGGVFFVGTLVLGVVSIYLDRQERAKRVVSQRPPSDTKPLEERLTEMVQGMRCRICGVTCGSAIAMLSPSGTVEFFPGWCTRHGGDLTRPLTTPVSGIKGEGK